MLTESYPNGMTATYTYNTAGKPTGLEYKKEKDCAEKCPETWFSDSVIPSIHGQWIEQTSTLSHQTYAYDNAGRLTEVQNTTGGKCTVRLYAYDEDSNRTSLTTRQPGTEGKCATEGGEGRKLHLRHRRPPHRARRHLQHLRRHHHPTRRRAPKTPNSPAPTTQTTSSRPRNKTNKPSATPSTPPAAPSKPTPPANQPKPTSSPTTPHPATRPHGPKTRPANWQRNITGINGSLAATQAEGANPVLQLTNLHGDIIATAAVAETATALLSKTDTSEFGVPTTSSPEKYAWLGAMGLPTELPSGVIAMGARSYVPQLGRFLQPDPIPGGSANAYSYTFGDPVNTHRPHRRLRRRRLPHSLQRQRNSEACRTRRQPAKSSPRSAARAAAERAAREAAEAAEAAAGPQYAGEEAKKNGTKKKAGTNTPHTSTGLKLAKVGNTTLNPRSFSSRWAEKLVKARPSLAP